MGRRDDELAGRILDRLYELRGRDAIPDLLEEARGAGASTAVAAARALALLEGYGLLKGLEAGPGPSYRGRLSAAGVRLYGRFGGGRALLRRLAADARAGAGGGETHYHGPVFLGDVGQSNVAFASEGVSQSVALAGPTRELLDELLRGLRADATLAAAAREEAIGDVASLRAELEKGRPNWKVVGYLLAGLGAIATAAEHVRKLRAALGMP